MKSQYLESYKAHVLESVVNGQRPYSVGTFLAYRLKGNAKGWISRYIRSLKNGLEKEGWIECSSKLGGVAYEPGE
jgi:hypothetical protein